jgi:hypothetical protein
MTRPFFVTTIVVLALCPLVSPANAAHVQCGDTITTNTTLDSDVACPNGSEYGLRIGADNVLLKLNGYAVRAGTGTVPTPGSGIISGPDPDGLSGVRIKRGAVQGFENGIDLGGFQNGVDLGPANDTTVFKVTVSGNPLFGIDLVGDRNRVEQSTVEGMGERGRGILFLGDDAYAWGNVIAGGQLGVAASGDRPRLVYNQVDCAPNSDAGVLAQQYTTAAVLNRNTVSRCADGVRVRSSSIDTGGAVVRLNEVSGSSLLGSAYGLFIVDGQAIVGRNTVSGGTSTGIYSELPGTRIQNNVAHDNTGYGIYGAQGTVDGGGNIAYANGDGTNPQCVNVECSAP